MQIAGAAAVASSAQEAQNTANLLSLAALYSTKVGGQDYSAEVNLSAGQYIATIPDLPGISATGGTLLDAENNLNLRVSILV
jgi:hypothetical protein